MSRLDTMARFSTPDPAGPEFHCGGCDYAFDLPREGEDVHACDCGRDLCADCLKCDPCRKRDEREEELRELAEAAMDRTGDCKRETWSETKMRTKEELEAALMRAREMANRVQFCGTTHPGSSYEDGTVQALWWALGNGNYEIDGVPIKKE